MEQNKVQPHLKLVTVALLMSNIMAGLDGTIVNTAMPAITSDLHALSYIGWIVAIFLLGMSASTPLWSKFGEHVGNKVAFLTATTLFIVGSIFQGSAQNILFFIISRAVMGIGAGGMNTIPMIAYGFLYDDLHQRAQVVGLSSAFFNTASIIGPLLGGWIVDTWNWRWIFYINVPIAIISITIVGLYFKPTHHGAAGKDIDYRGATLMVLGLTAILAGIEMIGSTAGWLVATVLVVGAILIVMMALTERHAQDPIIPGRLFANKKLVVDFSLFVVMWGAFIAFITYIPMWAQGILGMSAFIGGVTQIPGALTNFGGAEIAATAQERHPKYWLVTGGVVTLLVAFVIMLVFGQKTPFWLLLVAGAFEGFGVGFNFNILQVSVQTDVPMDDLPVATSVAYLLRILSQTMMSALYGVVLNVTLADELKKHSGITMKMMNQLTNAATAKKLATLMPTMKHILYLGYRNTILLAFALGAVCLVIALTVAIKQSRVAEN